MTINEIISELNKVLKEKNINAKITEKNTNISFKDSGIDSLQMIETVVAIESKLNITLPDEKLLELKTVKDLIDLIDKIKNKK
ncbi:MAG: acyl carrier protein [Malacoplasma sp.]|nr:acyl carrier protein [Malacoplasma sp.]